MTSGLIDPNDGLERQNEKLVKIVEALMRRIEKGAEGNGAAYAQFERAVRLEEEVRARTHDLERALDLLNATNAKLAGANAATEAARADLANAIEAVQEGFALFNPEDRLVMCNSRFCRPLRDIHAAFAPGLAFDEYVQLVSRSRFLDLEEDETTETWAAQRKTAHRENHVMFTIGMGEGRWFQVSEHRTPDGGTVVLQTDVTNMVQLERQERERLLDAQARLSRATLEHLNQGVLIFDSAHRLVGWNRRAGVLMTIPLRSFHIGAAFATLHDELCDKTTYLGDYTPRLFEAWVSSPRPSDPVSFELGVGGNRTLAVFAQRLPDEGFVVSLTDVTAERAALRALSEVNVTLEQRVMERTLDLEDALAEAERANASKSRFVAAASHDLLQPLSAAKLYVDALETEIADDTLRGRARKAKNAMQSVETILSALLDISKLDSGQAAVHLGDVPLDALLRQLCDEMAPMAAQKGLELRLVPTSAVVRSDAAYLRRILQNLISNAIRYTDRGRVLVGARRRGNSVRLEVRDTGPGIPESQQERIFLEFQRLNATASPSDGMGLGLAIVERACRLLKHPLHLVSAEGRGACFYIEAPRAGQRRSLPLEDRDTGAIAPIAGGQLVLLIENDADLRHALEITLENGGFDVFACASPAEAEALLDEVDIVPDAIVVDFRLGEGRFGTDAVRDLRIRFGPIPACVISADRSPELSASCASLGAELIHKPIEPEALFAFLKRASQWPVGNA